MENLNKLKSIIDLKEKEKKLKHVREMKVMQSNRVINDSQKLFSGMSSAMDSVRM